MDIKAFSDEFYRKVCGAKLQPVLDATVKARELGLHIEVVTLVIPGLNDSPEDTGALIRWILEHLGPDTPVHFNAYHPDYRMKEPGPTPVAVLERIYRQAREIGLHYPYLGNVYKHRFENTYCPVCGALLIERQGFSSVFRNLSAHRCTQCGKRYHTSAKRTEEGKVPSFLVDRMLGTLCRYLRFMGYDAESAPP